jgi:competence protein ComEC
VILLVLWVISVSIKKTRVGSWVAMALFFILGIFSIQNYLHPQLSLSHVSQFAGEERILLEGTVDRTPHRTRNGTQLYIQSHKVILSNRHIPVEGQVLLFMKEESKSFNMGDRLRFVCKLYPPRGFRNPGGFSYERHLAFERIYTIGFLSEKIWAKVGEGNKNPVLLLIEGWRNDIRDFIDKEIQPPSSGIIKALVLGERGDIPEGVAEQFTVTGIAHLLAISGDHLGIVALLSFSLLIWLLKRSEFLLLSLQVKKWAAGLTIPCILLYTFIAGGGISVIRATMMVIIFFLSILFDRERNLLHTLGLAAFLILMVSPPSLFDVSFQLSFLAVLPIVYLVPRLLKGVKDQELASLEVPSWKRNVLRYMKISLLSSVVATLGTAPFVALHFNRISLIGLLTNLFAIPWVGFLIVPLSLVASVLSFFLPPLAAFLLGVDQILTFVLLKGVGFFASLPLTSLFISTPTTFEIILFYLLLLAAAHFRRGRGVRYLFLGLLIVLVLDMGFWNMKDRFQKNLTLTFIDVGQGDSILIEFPKGKRMLIDGGGLYDDRFDTGKNVIAPFLWNKKIRKIDTLVLTHPDPDHLKGLNFIASHFSIGQFWESGYRASSEPYWQLEETLSKKKIERFSLNEATPPLTIHGVEISILNPPLRNDPYIAQKKSSFFNNNSLVMKLRFKNINILLTGDIEKETEYRIIGKDLRLKADLLKVPHHGSASSSTPPFLERVKPTYAILTVGERNIGRLPRPEVVNRYGQLGTKIFRTDRHGAITVTTDGEKVEIKPFVRTER